MNGVIQEPGQHYQFEGGTSFTFSEAPDEDDKVDIFFYRGKRGTDSVAVNTVETVKQGDILTLNKNDTMIQIHFTRSKNNLQYYNIR